LKIVLIGSGNIAHVFGRLIIKAGHTIIQVVSRNIKQGTLLAEKLKSDVTDSFEKMNPNADCYLFAVSDNALYDLENKISLGDKIAVHFSGTVSKDAFKNISKNYGVLYPLQSLHKDVSEQVVIPLIIDGNNPKAVEKIKSFAISLSPQVYCLEEEKRFKLHAAAVVVNNFTNHLFSMAENFCEREQVDFKLLLPLMNETVRRLDNFHANEVQTGPAVRNDTATMDRHIQLFSEYPKLKEFYTRFSKSIREAASDSKNF